MTHQLDEQTIDRMLSVIADIETGEEYPEYFYDSWGLEVRFALRELKERRAENAELRQQLAYYAGGDGKGLER